MTAKSAGPILVYEFASAPSELRALSTNGGDEDWLAVLPPGTESWRIRWLMASGFDSAHDPQLYPLPDGRVVAIGSHA